MKRWRNLLIIFGTVVRIMWLIAAALCVIAARRVRKFLAACRPWDKWQYNVPC